MGVGGSGGGGDQKRGEYDENQKIKKKFTTHGFDYLEYKTLIFKIALYSIVVNDLYYLSRCRTPSLIQL